MDGRGMIAGLFGAGDRRALRLRRPVPCARVSVPDAALRAPGWLAALCTARAAQHGDEAIQLVTPTGTALAFVASTTATAAAATPPPQPPAPEDLFA